MHRARSFALIVALVLVLSPSLTAVAAKSMPSRQDDELPIDITALAIYPADTGDDDYVILDGRSCLTVAACANPIFFGAATEESLTEAGLVRAHALALVKYADDGTAERIVATTIAEYVNPGGAGQGLQTFLSWLADPLYEVEVSGRIGSSAQLFNIPGALASDTNATGVVGLRFRSGELVLGVEMRDYTGNPPTSAEVEDLGRRIVELIEAERESPSLGALVVHHRAAVTEYYPHRNSRTVHLLREGSDSFAARSAEFSEADVDNVFITNQTLITGDDPDRPDVTLTIALYGLPTATLASFYLKDASSAFAAQRERNGAATRQPDDPPFVGDESVWFLNVYTDAYQAMGYVRYDNVVARITWTRNQDIPEGEEVSLLQTAEDELLAGTVYTAESQIDCLVNLACPGLTRLSSRLLPK
jgi:hypothetical protein